MTVISADSLDGDIWTTLLFGLGVEKGCAALRQRQDIDAIFVTKNRDIILIAATAAFCVAGQRLSGY